MEMENVVEIEVEVEEGKQGLSAYEIYLNSGGTLSEEEWLLSLKGEKGDTGENGITPTIGENGNWFMGDTDTGLPSRGEDGDSSGTVMILSEDDDATKIEKLLSVMEDGKVVRPLFYRTYNSGDEIPGIYELFQSYVDDSGRTFIFKCLFSNVYMVRFTVSSDNTLTKVALKSSWSDFVGTKEITGELENLSTEDKSNLVAAINEVANSSGGSTGLYNMTVSVTSADMQSAYNTDEIKEQFRQIIQDIYNSGQNNAIINMFNLKSGSTKIFYNSDSQITEKDTSITFMETINSGTNRLGAYTALCNSQIQCNCTWSEDGIVTITGIYNYTSTFYYLSTTNTQSYTPTASTHPATKGYVDNLVGDISTVLATLTTVSEVSE